MKRGSGQSPKKTNSSRRGKPSRRERTTLIVLLAAIAVLLGVLVALLPDSARPDDAALVDGGDPGVAEDDAGTSPALGGEGEERQVPGGDPAADRLRTDPDTRDEGPVTEGYPAGEAPDGAGPRGEGSGEAAPEDELWWLPDSPPPPDERGPLVLVLDDAGNSLDGFDAFLELPIPFAVAVLPQLDYSVQAAAMAAGAGKEILLHLPMEPDSGADPGPGAIRTGLPVEEIAARVREDLASVPGAIGVNNHMGSKATADPEVMRAVLDALHERDLFFLDSRTSAATTGRSVAAEIGIPFAERAVFLDHERTRESILRSLGHALEESADGEPVVMIGHVTVPLLAEVLREARSVIIDAGYEFAALSTLVSPVRVASGEAE